MNPTSNYCVAPSEFPFSLLSRRALTAKRCSVRLHNKILRLYQRFLWSHAIFGSCLQTRRTLNAEVTRIYSKHNNRIDIARTFTHVELEWFGWRRTPRRQEDSSHLFEPLYHSLNIPFKDVTSQSRHFIALMFCIQRTRKTLPCCLVTWY